METTGVATFAQQSEIWLDSLKTRKRKPVSPSTLHAFGSYVRRLTLMIGEMKLADINNGTLKQLVHHLDHDEKLSAKTINELVFVVKQVVASVVDPDTGEPIFKREWSARFIDCPTVGSQKQPCVTARDVERCLNEATSEKEKLLYTLLAGSGLRIAEALAVHVSGSEGQTSWDLNRQAIYVRSSVFNGKELSRLKTTAARRTVDLDPRLSDLIAQYVETNKIKAGDYLFQSRSGPRRPMHVNTARHWLVDRGIPGFHAFRRFRITRLREIGVPEDILRYWVGHSGIGITDRYSKLGECADLRKQWSVRAELGFELPTIGKPGDPPPTTDSPRSAVKPAEPGALTDIAPAPYVGVDSDLPELFFQPIEHAL